MSDVEVKYVSSSKKDIWDAYKALKAKVDGNAPELETTTAVAEKNKVSSAVKVATAVDVDAVSASITEFVSKVGDVKGQYTSIVTAIESKKQELQEIHGIEVEANTLVAIVATKDKMIADKTEFAVKIVAEAQAKADAILTQANESAQAVRTAIILEKKETDVARKRDEEEYKYSFLRTKKATEDKLQDELNAKVKIIVEREETVAAREALANEKDAKVIELTQQIATINAEVTKKVEAASAEATKSAERSANFVKMMATKEHEAQVSIKDARIETLTEKVSELSVQLDKAQLQVKDVNDKLSDMAKSVVTAQSQADAATVNRVAEVVAAGASGKTR